MLNLIKKIVGTKNDREVKRIRPYVEKINGFEAQLQSLSDDELLAKTDEFKGRIREATAQLRTDLEEARAQAVNSEIEQREELKSRVEELDKELRQAEAEVLDEILAEAFAAVPPRQCWPAGLRPGWSPERVAAPHSLQTGRCSA